MPTCRKTFAILAIVITCFSQLAFGADMDNAAQWGRENIAAGKYADAVTQLEKSLAGAAPGSPERRGIALVMIEAQRILGKVTDAIALCDELLKTDANDTDVALLRADLDMDRGNYTEASDAFSKVIADHADNDRAWALRSIAMRALNDRAGLKKTNDHFYDTYTKKQEYFNSDSVKDPLELAYIGLGFEDENPKDAFETGYMLAEGLAEARKSDEPEIYLWSARLADRKYHFGYAEERFVKLLKMRPNLPDAVAGRASILMEVKHDLNGAEKLLTEGLKVNPNHVECNLVQALIDVEEDRMDEAKKHIDTAVASNPRELHALAMEGFFYVHRMEMDKYAEVEKKALAVNPKCADFYCDIGELCEDKLRFDSSAPWYQKAIDVDPDYWRGYYGLGMNLSRQGADSCEKGKALLLVAFKKNRFNPWAANMIKALDNIIGDKEQDVAPKYLESKTKHFTLRYSKKEAGIVEPYLAEWAEAAYDRQVKLFGYEPEGPLSIELCYTMQDQAARTVGLPNLGALGVCFGKLCTVVSPREGQDRSTATFNWRKVLEHEFGHVMALQLSHFRVPRWYTEAFSTYLEDDTRIESDGMMVNYIARDKLLPIDKMNEYFRDNILMAYVHGRYVIEYIAKNFGFEAHVKAMKLFAEGKTLTEVLPAVTGKTIAELNAGAMDFTKKFFEHVRLRPTPDPAMLVQLELAAKSDDASAQDIANLAIAMTMTRKLDKAEALAKRALAKDEKCVDALIILGALAYEKKDFEGAKQTYLKSTAIDPGRSFAAWQRLGIIYRKEGHTTKAIEAYEAARKSYPRYIGEHNPHYELAEMYEEDSDPPQLEKALGVWRDAINVNTQDPEACLKGLKLAVKLKDTKAIIEFANAHIEIDPYKPEVHQILGKTYEDLKDYPHAEREYSVNTFLNDKDVDSWVALARARSQQGKFSEAKKAVEAALEIDGTNAEAKKLRDTLNEK